MNNPYFDKTQCMDILDAFDDKDEKRLA